MQSLFQIKDYIKISSKNYAKEFGDKVIRFERPELDPRYWLLLGECDETFLMRKVLLGQKICVTDNDLSIELPREMANDRLEIENMVRMVFGGKGAKPGILPLNSKIWNLYSISMAVVPGSATWEFIERGICVHFDTEVSLIGKAQRLAPRELAQGVKFMPAEMAHVAKVVTEVVMDTEAVEYVASCNESYIIMKSMDVSVQKNKFYLENRESEYFDEWDFLNLVYTFSPHRITDELRPYVTNADLEFKREQRPFGFRKNLVENCYKVYATPGSKMCQRMGYLTSLRSALSQGLKDIAARRLEYNKSRNRNKCEDFCLPAYLENYKGNSFRYGMNGGTMQLTLDPSNEKEMAELEQELRLRHSVISVICDFLTDDMGVDDRSEKEVNYFILNYAYDSIIADPMVYVNARYKNFSEFARNQI